MLSDIQEADWLDTVTSWLCQCDDNDDDDDVYCDGPW